MHPGAEPVAPLRPVSLLPPLAWLGAACPQIPVNAVSTPSLPNGLELQRLLESVGMVQYEGFFQALPSEDWRVLSAEPLEGC